MSSLKKKERVKNKTNKKNLDKGNTREAPLAYLHQPSCLLSIHSPHRVATAPQSARSADLSPHQLRCTALPPAVLSDSFMKVLLVTTWRGRLASL